MAMERYLGQLRVLLHDPMLSKNEALNLLTRIQRGDAEIPAVNIFTLLQNVDIEDMKTRPHRGKSKENDRSFGQKLRKIRTGSRRG